MLCFVPRSALALTDEFSYQAVKDIVYHNYWRATLFPR